MLLALAGVLRFTYVIAYPQLPLCPDCVVYDEVGMNLTDGFGFVGGVAAQSFDLSVAHDPHTPEIGIGPVYPAFLGLIYRVAGHRLDVARVIQAALSTFLLFPLFTIARWTFQTRTALAAAALAAIYPGFIIYSGMILTEALSTVFLVTAVWAVMWSSRGDGPWRWVLAGAVMGVLILLRAEVMFLTAVVAALVWWRNPITRTTAMLALYVAVIALTIAPWTARNYRVFHRFIPVSARDGDTLWISVKGWTTWRFDDPEVQALVRGRTFLEQEDAFHEAAIREILRHPAQAVRTRLMRFPDFWLTGHTAYVVGLTASLGEFRARHAILPFVVKGALLALNMTLIAAGLLGLGQAVRRPDLQMPDVLLLAAPIGLIAAVHLALYTSPRYQVPMMPFLLVFAGWFCVGLLPGARR
jgi:4-amino-4-deoxy-L-arabinose transferase-like glycosyltransferase